jgi:hypothetical protein
MNTRLLIIGLITLGFGLLNIFWYWPTSAGIALMNHPFPFQHLAEVIAEHGGHSIVVRHIPIEAAIDDPYWLIWSLSLYFGIVILSILGIRSLRQKHE